MTRVSNFWAQDCGWLGVSKQIWWKLAYQTGPLRSTGLFPPPCRCRWSMHSPAPTAVYHSINSIKAWRGLETCLRGQEAPQVWLLRFQLHLRSHLCPVSLSLPEACLSSGPLCLEWLAKNSLPKLSATGSPPIYSASQEITKVGGAGMGDYVLIFIYLFQFLSHNYSCMPRVKLLCERYPHFPSLEATIVNSELILATCLHGSKERTCIAPCGYLSLGLPP